MRTASIDLGEARLKELIAASREEPVTLLANGKPAIVVLSLDEFARLDEQDRIRREAKARLRDTIAAMHAEAASKGLTDAEVERLLADES